MGGSVQSRRASFSFTALLALGVAGLLGLVHLGDSLLRALPQVMVLDVSCPLVLAALDGRLSANAVWIFPWIGFGMLLGGLCNALYRAGRTLLHLRWIRRRLFLIPAAEVPRLTRVCERLNLRFELNHFQGDGVEGVFTMGLWKPKVYVSTGLCRRLSNRELEGVLLHEAHHVQRKDPLRQFLAAFICNFLFFLPLSSVLKDIFFDAKEKAADDTAVKGLEQPLELASALVKLAAGPSALASPTLAGLAGGDGLALERVERLLGKRGDEWPRVPFERIFGTGLITGCLLFLCL